MAATHADLDRIRVRYVTFRQASAGERTAGAESLSRLPARERVMLDTCHRVELVTVDEAPVDGETVDGEAAFGRDAVQRVFEVVAGFDSAVVAEEQLLGQVRDAFETALADGSSGPVLNELFRRALRFGRLVRSHALPGSDRSLAARAAGWLGERLAPSSRVLVAGTGEMARLTASVLAEQGHAVTIVSRSEERGRRAIAPLGPSHRLQVGGLDASLVAAADAIVLAVRSREPVLDASMLPRSGLPWVVDLSAPAAVAADAASVLGDSLLTLDALGQLGSAAPVLRDRSVRRLRRQLEVEVDRFVSWLESRGSASAVELLHHEAEAVRRRHVERLQRRVELAPEQIAAFDAAAAAMLNELLHRPSVELKAGGADAEAVRRLFGLDGTR